MVVSLLAINGGALVAKMIEGEIRLHSDQHPEGDETHPLSGVEIVHGTPHVTEIFPKGYLLSPQAPGIAPAKILCKAVYIRAKHSKGEASAIYAYNHGLKRFVRES
jgi:hypothetical protein